MKYSRLSKLLMLLLFQFPISSVSIENNHNHGWVHAEIGKDNKNKYYAILENNLIKCKYGWRHHKEPRDGQSYIRELMLKSVNCNMGDWLDAAAGKRGPLTNVTLVCDRDDKKTVRLEWNDSDKIQEVTIYPNSLILRIDYIKLLDDGFEFFPFWKIPSEKRTFPFTGYLFLVDGGGSEEIIGTGKRIIDNLSINNGAFGRYQPRGKN